jgi:hypothetical protein
MMHASLVQKAGTAQRDFFSTVRNVKVMVQLMNPASPARQLAIAQRDITMISISVTELVLTQMIHVLHVHPPVLQVNILLPAMEHRPWIHVLHVHPPVQTVNILISPCAMELLHQMIHALPARQQVTVQMVIIMIRRYVQVWERWMHVWNALVLEIVQKIHTTMEQHVMEQASLQLHALTVPFLEIALLAFITIQAFVQAKEVLMVVWSAQVVEIARLGISTIALAVMEVEHQIIHVNLVQVLKSVPTTRITIQVSVMALVQVTQAV